MRSEDLSRELIDSPGEDQIPDRDEIEHNRRDDRQEHRQVAQVGDREVEEILHLLAKTGYVADRVLNCLRHLLDRLQTLLQTLLLFLKNYCDDQTRNFLCLYIFKDHINISYPQNGGLDSSASTE